MGIQMSLNLTDSDHVNSTFLDLDFGVTRTIEGGKCEFEHFENHTLSTSDCI